MKDPPRSAPSATLIDVPRNILKTPQRSRPLFRLVASWRKLLAADLQRDRVDLRLYELVEVHGFVRVVDPAPLTGTQAHPRPMLLSIAGHCGSRSCVTLDCCVLKEALARADGRSFSNFVIHVLRQHVGLPDLAVPSAIKAPDRATSEREAKTRKKRGTRNP